MKTFDSYLAEKLKNPQIRREYDALESEYAIDKKNDKRSSPVKKRYKTLAEYFARYSGDYKPTEIDTGNDVGREVVQPSH